MANNGRTQSFSRGHNFTWDEARKLAESILNEESDSGSCNLEDTLIYNNSILSFCDSDDYMGSFTEGQLYMKEKHRMQEQHSDTSTQPEKKNASRNIETAHIYNTPTRQSVETYKKEADCFFFPH